jgi:hypothetical protein
MRMKSPGKGVRLVRELYGQTKAILSSVTPPKLSEPRADAVPPMAR